jgi:hypothetical protein
LKVNILGRKKKLEKHLLVTSEEDDWVVFRYDGEDKQLYRKLNTDHPDYSQSLYWHI